jgi:DMSO/TMAO reductase YedYZ molybdopterin-dependent catalytic subunit
MKDDLLSALRTAGVIPHPSSLIPQASIAPKRVGMRESLKDQPKSLIAKVERRLFLRRGLSLGALAMLTGCDVTNGESVQKVLWAMSRWNDGVQGWLFDPDRLAPEFPETRIAQPFPFNAFYGKDEIPRVDASGYRLEVSGLVREKKAWSLAELHALPQVSQVTRLICVEGWSAIGKWSGVRFSEFLRRIGADTTARYVGLRCADKYWTSIDMPTALHPQTLLALGFGDRVLPPEYGFPIKLRMPTKLGFKNPKHVVALFVTNDYPGGYWEDQGYNWFSGS